jgi:hypothetical protein
MQFFGGERVAINNAQCPGAFRHCVALCSPLPFYLTCPVEPWSPLNLDFSATQLHFFLVLYVIPTISAISFNDENKTEKAIKVLP